MNTKILIVDHEENQRTLIQSRLEQEGYDVLVARNADEAFLHQAQNPEIGVLITSLKLQGKDGLSVIKEMAQKNSSMKAIIVADSGQKDEVIRALQLGVANYFEKPFQMEAFFKAVESSVQKFEKELFYKDLASHHDSKFKKIEPISSEKKSNSSHLSLVSSAVQPQNPLDNKSENEGENATLSYTELKRRWSDDFEKDYLVNALARHEGNVSAAAREAKLDRSNFLRLLRRHHINAEAYRKTAAKIAA